MKIVIKFTYVYFQDSHHIIMLSIDHVYKDQIYLNATLTVIIIFIFINISNNISY